MGAVPSSQWFVCSQLDTHANSPGRFFAANELKALLAFLLVNYDFEFAGDAPTMRPPNVHFAEAVIPNPSARLMFRKRRAGAV